MTKPIKSTSPQHVGVIMDGNRRWAKARGLDSFEGHLKGYQNLKDLAMYALIDKKIPFISAYVFSTENWSRTEAEVGYLMKLVTRALTEFLEEFNKNNIRVVVLGQREKLSKEVLSAVDKAETTTKNNTGGTLVACFNYGGHAEIVDAAKKIAAEKIEAADINEELFAQKLYHPEVPPVDLIIRTSGEQRLSGFMLWRASYSELLFVDKHWPEFDKTDIDAALEEYSNRQRNFGV